MTTAQRTLISIALTLLLGRSSPADPLEILLGLWSSSPTTSGTASAATIGGDRRSSLTTAT